MASRHAVLESSVILSASTDISDALRKDYKISTELLEDIVGGRYDQVLTTPTACKILGTQVEDDIDEIPIDAWIQKQVETYLQHSQEDLCITGELSVLYVGISCLQLFVQNNWTGPPADLEPQDLLPKAYRHMDKVALAKAVENILIVDGESAYNLTCHPLYLVLARTILIDCRHSIRHLETWDWWVMRCIQIHQALLDERSPTLKATVMQIIQEVSKKEIFHEPTPTYRDFQLQFYIEAGHLMYFYYEPKEAKVYFTKATDISSLKIQHTGVMGKRTRWQEKDVAQLVLQVERLGVGDAKPELELKNADTPQVPKNVALNDDTVLDQLLLTETEIPARVLLSDTEQALLLALCHHHRKSHEGIGDILKEESLAYIIYILHQPQNWAIQSMCMLHRCRWEQESSRRMERTMAQLEELTGQFQHSTTNAAQRMHLVYAAQLPPIWEIKREYGQLLVTVGVLPAALEVFLGLNMWEDIIKCYTQLGHRGKAEEVIRAQLAENETPSLWCYLGDVLREPAHYQKAWELSGSHYSRAMKCMAYHYLHHGQFEESLGSFEKTLELNPLQIGVWFSYGCAAMACKKYEDAAKAFRRCVMINSDNYEAWNNLSTSYIRLNQKPRAFASLQEALKWEYENWRLWENFLLVGMDCGEFEDAIRAYHRLLDLKQKYADAEVLGILVRAVNEGIEDAHGVSAAGLRQKVLELFGRVSSVVTNNAEIWNQYAKLLVGGSTEPSQSDRERALQYLQKCHRSLTQTPGWEKNLETCVKIAQESASLAKTYQSVSKGVTNKTQATQMLGSARLMLKGVLTKIRQQHTDPVTQELDELLATHCKELESELVNIVELVDQLRDT